MPLRRRKRQIPLPRRESLKEKSFTTEDTGRLRVVFWGSSEFAIPSLEYLLREPTVDLVLIITRAPKPAGRGRKLMPTSVGAFVGERCPDKPLVEAGKLKSNRELLERIRVLAPDAYLLAAYGKIVPPEYLELTPHPLGIHPSPLPLLRGPSPIRTALLQGMTETGVSLFRMVQEMDAGEVMLYMRLPILPQDDYGTLHQRLSLLAVEVTRAGLNQLRSGDARFFPQDETKATFTSFFRYEDTLLDFSRSAEELHRFVRAMSPDLGAVCLSQDGKKLKLFGVHPVPCPVKGAPGEVVAVTKKTLILATGEGCVEVEKLQPENRRVMSTQEWLAGQRLAKGARFRSAKPSSAA